MDINRRLNDDNIQPYGIIFFVLIHNSTTVLTMKTNSSVTDQSAIHKYLHTVILISPTPLLRPLAIVLRSRARYSVEGNRPAKNAWNGIRIKFLVCECRMRRKVVLQNIATRKTDKHRYCNKRNQSQSARHSVTNQEAENTLLNVGE